MVLAALWLLPLIAALPGVLLLASAALTVPWWGKTRPPPLRIGWLSAGLLGAASASAAFSVAGSASWPNVVLAGAYLTVVWVVARQFSQVDRRQRALDALFWGMVPWAAFGIAVAALRFEWGLNWGSLRIQVGTWDHRANSIFLHPNILSGYLLFAIAAGLAAARGRWAIYGPPLAVLAVCQVMTQSRSGWVGTIVLLVVFLSLTAGASLGAARLRPAWAKIAVAAAAVAIAAPLAWPRLETLFDPAYPSNVARFRVWGSAWEMIAARPLLGWGPESWTQAYQAFRHPLESENLPHAHNLFLHLGAEYGLPMTVLLGCLVGTVAARAARATWRDHAGRGQAFPLVAAIAGYVVMGLFEFTFSEGRNGVALFATVGLLAALALGPRTGDRVRAGHES